MTHQATIDSAAGARRNESLSIWYRRLAWLLLFLALLRGLHCVVSDPLLAIANNYDMIRVQACIDAWPDRAISISPAAGSPDAPIARYRFVEGVGAPCFLTSEVLFAWVAWPGMWMEQTMNPESTFSIRWMGAVHLVFLCMVAVWCSRRLIAANRADLAAGHALVVLLALADPGNLLYFNTYYAESSSLLFLYALLATILVALARSGPPARALLAAIFFWALLLATSKIQHMFVPAIVFLVVMLLRAVKFSPPRTLLLALGSGAVLGLAIQVVHMHSSVNEPIRSANLVNTLFTAMLPNASQPGDLIALLGLPGSCVEYSGASWYTPGMVSRSLCPEVFQLRQSHLLGAAITYPVMTAKMMFGGVEYMSHWIPPELGVVEGGVMAGLPPSVPSFSRLFIVMIPMAMALMIGGLPLLATFCAFRRRLSEQLGVNVILLVLSVLPICVLAASVFGDGYVDLSKHAHLGFSTLLAAFAVLACLLVDRVLRRLSVSRVQV